MDYGDYVNGYIERVGKGEYSGNIMVDGVDLSPIEAYFFKRDKDLIMFIKRKPVMDYDFATQRYTKRERKPELQIYMRKQLNDNVVAFVGEFMFLRFKYKIEGVWDKILGKEKNRINLFVERLPLNEQTLLQNINKKKRENEE